MLDFSGDLSPVVFKRVLRPFQGEISLDCPMLSLLLELDGKSDLQSVAGAMGISLSEIRDLLLRLDKLDLIEADLASVPILDVDFFSFLTDQLSLALGPMADILIDDEISDMGLKKERVPSQRAAELVGALAREIPRDEKRNLFRQQMLKKIKSI